jgi:ribonucleoside-triphosphate reductase
MVIYDDAQMREEREVRFKLAPETKLHIGSLKETFTEYASVVYLRTYARKKKNDKLEAWKDTVCRTISGLFYFMKKQKKTWDEEAMQALARKMAESMFKCEWLPPGRGLWAMKRRYIEKYGSIALNNCAFVSTYTELVKGVIDNVQLADSAKFLMDVSMLGAGCGFDCRWNGTVYLPKADDVQTIAISDDREGWSQSVYDLLASYLIPNSPSVRFEYHLIRKKGSPIRGFGGVAAGPEVLELLHHRLRSYAECRYRVQQGMSAKDSIRIAMAEEKEYGIPYFKEHYDEILADFEKTSEEAKTYSYARFVTDIMNAVGICVISGNVRRSSEISLGFSDDEEFIALKDYIRNPERGHIGYMSNNSVMIMDESEYDPTVRRIVPLMAVNGEPGILNLAVANALDEKNPNGCRCHLGVNPCGEICLCHKELCCLVEVFPTNCLVDGVFDKEHYLEVCRYASIWASVVSCIPTLHPDIDAVVSKNHRIGVSQTGVFKLYDTVEEDVFDDIMASAYEEIKKTSDEYVYDFCGTYPIAHTTIKPSGTVSILGQVPSGLHPPKGTYMMRRVTFDKDLELTKELIKMGVPYEQSKYDANSVLLQFPLKEDGCRNASEVIMEELGDLLVKLQRGYSDNSVSASVYFSKEEAELLADYLLRILPYTKSISFFPREDTPYDQSPFTSISKEEYEALAEKIPKFTTQELSDRLFATDESDGFATKYCDSMACSLA